jgi:hypothetical protein
MRALAFVFTASLVGGAAIDAWAQPPPEPPPAQPPPGDQPPPAQPPGDQPPAAQPPSAQPPPAQPLPAQPGPPTGPAPPGQPPYGQPYPYGTPYGGPLPPPGPPPLVPEEPDCCRFAVRFDPFDLLFRRLSFQTELAIWGPLSIEAEPSWIFGAGTENLDLQGGALQGNFLVYFTGKALKGFYAKAIVGFEAYEATLVDPELKKTAKDDLASPILGLAIGSSAVFGEEFGFNLAGGIGIGFATAEKKTLQAGRYEVVFYDKASSIQLLASLGLGIAF